MFPLVAVGQAIRDFSQRNSIDIDVRVLGEGNFIRQACAENNLQFRSIVAGKWRRYFSFFNFLDILKVPVSFIQSLWHVFWYMPDVVFTKGSYASVIPALVAKLYLIPLYTHESDSVPGRANTLIASWSRNVFVSFKSSEKFFKPGKAILTGNPIRKELFGADKNESLNFFDLDKSRKTLFIAGGSQGSQVINNIVLETLPSLLKDYNVIHQCGESQIRPVTEYINTLSGENIEMANQIKLRYRLYPFLNVNELAKAYTGSDAVITRAGAANISEISALGKPTIVIPITESSGNHQMMNAQEFVNFGAIVIQESNLSSSIFISQLRHLFENITEISSKISGFAITDAADKIASVICGQ